MINIIGVVKEVYYMCLHRSLSTRFLSRGGLLLFLDLKSSEEQSSLLVKSTDNADSAHLYGEGAGS